MSDLMRTGELVRIYIGEGMHKIGKYQNFSHRTKLSDVDYHNVLVSHGGREEIQKFDAQSIRRWTPLQPGRVEDFGRQNFDSLTYMINEAACCLHLGVGDKITKQPADSIVYVGERVSVQPSKTVRRTIGGEVETACWTVSVWSQSPASRDEEADVSECVVAVCASSFDAARKAMEAAFKVKVEEFFDRMSEAHLAEDMEM